MMKNEPVNNNDVGNGNAQFFNARKYVERKSALEEAAAAQKMFWLCMGTDKRKAINADGIHWKSIPRDVGKSGPALRMRFCVQGDDRSVEIKVLDDGRWQLRKTGNFENWGFCKLAELLVDELFEEKVL